MSYNLPISHIDFRSYEDNKPINGYGGHITVEGYPDSEPRLNKLEHDLEFLSYRVDSIEDKAEVDTGIMIAINDLYEKYEKLLTALETMERGDELYKLLNYAYEGDEN